MGLLTETVIPQRLVKSEWGIGRKCLLVVGVSTLTRQSRPAVYKGGVIQFS